jgi:beta-glucanase (GH16 family)
MISNPAAFHTYAVEWTSSSIKIIYDGSTCLLHTFNPALPLTNAQPFDQPFIIALTQALGIATNQFDPGTTPLPATTEVDYVRVWQWRPGPSPVAGPPHASASSLPGSVEGRLTLKKRSRRACKAARKGAAKRRHKAAKRACRATKRRTR